MRLAKSTLGCAASGFVVEGLARLGRAHTQMRDPIRRLCGVKASQYRTNIARCPTGTAI